MNTLLLATTPDCEIVSQRIFPVAQELLFRAWAEPEHLQNWWGPKGFTNTFNEFDFRLGGKWRFVMHGPEKGHYVNECEFIKIEQLSLIAWKRHSQPLFNVVATFEAVTPSSTLLVFKMLFATPEECNKLRPFVVDKNEENFDKLADELAKMR